MRIFKNKWFHRWAKKESVSDAKANISTKEEAALSIAAESFISATDEQVQALLKANSITEVNSRE